MNLGAGKSYGEKLDAPAYLQDDFLRRGVENLRMFQ